VLSYQEDYVLALSNPNDTLYLYLDSHAKVDVNRLRSYFSPDSKLDRRIAILKLVYEIDPEIPFLNRFPSSTVSDIIHSFGNEACTDDEWLSLSDGRFLSWMYSHEDYMACEALRIMTSGKTPSRSLGYKVLYNIDRNAAYDLKEALTPYKVGEVLRQDLMNWQNLSDKEYEEKVKAREELAMWRELRTEMPEKADVIDKRIDDLIESL
jgi:hypothetical protein